MIPEGFFNTQIKTNKQTHILPSTKHSQIGLHTDIQTHTHIHTSTPQVRERVLICSPNLLVLKPHKIQFC